MKCPNCHAVVPNRWKVCRCGHQFIATGKPDIRKKSETTKPMGPVSKPVYEKRDVRDEYDEYREQLRKDASTEKTHKLPVEDLLKEVKESEEEQAADHEILDSGIDSAEVLNGESRKLSFHGNGSTLFGIHLLNIFLTAITLGIYYFWGKIKIRRYMYSQSEFEGDRFEFLGTGGELLLGFIKAVVVVGAFIGCAELAKHLYPGIYSEILGGVILYLVILLLTPIALVLTQRYRFSRTSWRYVRFSFRGKVKPFLSIYIPGLIFTTFTLGIYYYFLHHKTRQYLVNNAYFGDTRFSYDGEINALFRKFIKAIIISIFTLGIYWFWFAAERHSYYWSHTKFSNCRFSLDIKGGDFFKLKIVDIILLLFTVGLADPFVKIRDTRFLFERLSLRGELNLEDIIQDARSPSALGEEVADILDLDLVGMDMGI